VISDVDMVRLVRSLAKEEMPDGGAETR
jgi:hypothetical protein